LNKIVRSERKLRAELGREPSSVEIGRDLDLTPEEVEQIRRSAQTPVSLEKPVGDEDESEFGHFLTDENLPLPDEEAEITLRKETLRKILGTLSSRERQVLELRYGLDGQHPRTLDEVGRAFNVTRERIRQIENQSLKKLRALADAAKLREVGLGEIPATAGNGSAPTVMVYGHYDVQPPAPIDLWESPPFELAERDGWYYGRGIADDKGQLYTLVKAAQLLAKNAELPVNIRIACDGEEEIGGHTIVDFLEQDEPGADACVIFDGHITPPE